MEEICLDEISQLRIFQNGKTASAFSSTENCPKDKITKTWCVCVCVWIGIYVKVIF